MLLGFAVTWSPELSHVMYCLHSCNTAAIWSYISALKWLRVWYGLDDLSSAGRELGLVQSKGSQPTLKGVQCRNVNQITQKKKDWETTDSFGEILQVRMSCKWKSWKLLWQGLYCMCVQRSVLWQDKFAHFWPQDTDTYKTHGQLSWPHCSS